MARYCYSKVQILKLQCSVEESDPVPLALVGGLSLNSKCLKIQFMVMFVEVNITFVPKHLMGLAGIPGTFKS
jgi:hypothetical protein